MPLSEMSVSPLLRPARAALHPLLQGVPFPGLKTIERKARRKVKVALAMEKKAEVIEYDHTEIRTPRLSSRMNRK